MRESNQCLQTRRKPRAVSTFLKKTYELLNDQQNLNAVRWADNGIGFIVLNQDLFSKIVLPKYFKHSNYSSFVRQLNMYNFHKIRQNNSQSYFHHLSFDKENEQKLCQIKRKPEKKKRKNGETDEEIVSENQEKQTVKPLLYARKTKEEIKPSSNPLVEKQLSDKKIVSEQHTNHFGSQSYHQSISINNQNWKIMKIDQEQDDKISINNQITERFVPKLATRELFYPSNSNLFPFGGRAQTSTFCLFF